MGRFVALCVVLLWPSLAYAERLEPASTWAVVAGVLEWQDPGLASFSKQNRKDQELFEVLGARGVPANQRTLLLDTKASASAVEAALEDIAKRAPTHATLIFYFAGHGVKDQSGHIIFTTADTRLDQLDNTGLHLSRLQRTLDKFKGKRIILLADCCHSGGLVDVAKALSKKRGAMALTSSEASNISTANWTFTQTVIDGLRGRGIQDHDGDGAIELFEVVGEVKDAMKHRESQRFGFGNHGVTDELVFANVGASPAPRGQPDTHASAAPSEKHDESGAVKRREWVLAPRDRGKQVARVLSVQGERAQVEFYDYSTYDLRWVPARGLEVVTSRTWPVGAQLDVTWQGQVYLAKVIAVDDGFMRITYPGYESSWDEWIGASRVVGEAGARKAKQAKVEWNGRWYDAVVESEKDGRYCISYVGFTSAWDECVEKKRIRF